ncbi:MAG TPA: protoheme IX farnesyltransferase, partial [Acidobacteriota bacterium]|nr:protoheme IX farnesyltransferase [Acidobacteriota bacterium]
SLCTLMGAVPGAIPPVMGWTAVTGSISFQAWWLFAILFLWQLPHFLSIAWLYREDYARGGFPMLPVLDPEGVRTSRHIILETLALMAVSLMPSLFGMTGSVYMAGALLLGGGFLIMSLRLSRSKSNAAARRLLLTSVIYLPLLLTLMVLDRTF